MALAQNPKNCHLWQNEMETWHPKCLKPPVFRISACVGMRVIEVFRAYGGVMGMFVQLGNSLGMGASFKTDFRNTPPPIGFLFLGQQPSHLSFAGDEYVRAEWLQQPSYAVAITSSATVHPRASARTEAIRPCAPASCSARWCRTSCASLLCVLVIRIVHTT